MTTFLLALVNAPVFTVRGTPDWFMYNRQQN